MDKNNIADLNIEQEQSKPIYIKSGNTTVEVVTHFSSERTYKDIIKAALRREFAE